MFTKVSLSMISLRRSMSMMASWTTLLRKRQLKDGSRVGSSCVIVDANTAIIPTENCAVKKRTRRDEGVARLTV